MDKITYSIGLLHRLHGYNINNQDYVLLSDVEYILKNGDIFENEEEKVSINKEPSIMDILDRRPGTWPEYYDECDAQDYHEWFIKGTNIKLGFDYIDGVTNEHCWYKIVCDGYDMMDPYYTEEDFLEDIEWMLKNKDLSWRYYE